MLVQAAEGQQVASRSQARDLPQGDSGNVGLVAEWLALMDVR
jgi:hypothetical protein